MLRQARISVNEYPFPDHHDYHREDFDVMKAELPVVMTEKDAVKAEKLGLRNAWSLEVDAVLPAAFESAFLKRILELPK